MDSMHFLMKSNDHADEPTPQPWPVLTGNGAAAGDGEAGVEMPAPISEDAIMKDGAGEAGAEIPAEDGADEADLPKLFEKLRKANMAPGKKNERVAEVTNGVLNLKTRAEMKALDELVQATYALGQVLKLDTRFTNSRQVVEETMMGTALAVPKLLAIGNERKTQVKKGGSKKEPNVKSEKQKLMEKLFDPNQVSYRHGLLAPNGDLKAVILTLMADDPAANKIIASIDTNHNATDKALKALFVDMATQQISEAFRAKLSTENGFQLGAAAVGTLQGQDLMSVFVKLTELVLAEDEDIPTHIGCAFLLYMVEMFLMTGGRCGLTATVKSRTDKKINIRQNVYNEVTTNDRGTWEFLSRLAGNPMVFASFPDPPAPKDKASEKSVVTASDEAPAAKAKAEEERQALLAAEQEAKRVAAEAKAEEERQAHLAAEQEAKRLAAEAKAEEERLERLAAEAKARFAAEAKAEEERLERLAAEAKRTARNGVGEVMGLFTPNGASDAPSTRRTKRGSKEDLNVSSSKRTKG